MKQTTLCESVHVSHFCVKIWLCAMPCTGRIFSLVHELRYSCRPSALYDRREGVNSVGVLLPCFVQVGSWWLYANMEHPGSDWTFMEYQ